MGNNTAELTVVLKADGSGLTGTVRVSADEVRKLGGALDETGKKATDAGRKIEDAGKQGELMGKLLGAGAAAAAAGFALLVKNQIDYAANLATTATRIGTTTEQLSALYASARRNDSDTKAIVSGLDSVAEAAGRAGAGAGQGAKQFNAAFSAIGVSVNDANGHLRPTVQIMEDVARGLAKLPDGALKTRIATQLLGDAGKDLNATLNDLAANGMQGLIDKATETGEVISGTAAAQAHKFKDELQELQTRVTVFAQGVAQDALPTLLALTGVLLESGNAAKDTGGNVSTLQGFMQGLGTVVLTTKETFYVLFTMILGGGDILLGVGQIVKGLIDNLVYAAAAVVALSTGSIAQAKELSAKASAALADGWEQGSQRIASAWSNITSAGAESDARLKVYQDRISAGNREIAETAAAAAAQQALVARNAAAVKGTQFEHVAAGSASIGADQGAAAVAKANEAAAAQKRLEEGLARTGKAAHAATGDMTLLDRILADAADGAHKADQFIEQLALGLGGPYAQAQAKYEAGLKTLAKGFVDNSTQLNLGVIDQRQYAEEQARLSDAAADLGDWLDRENQHIKEQHDLLGNLASNTKYEQSLLRMSDRQKAFAEASKKATDQFKQNPLVYTAAGIGMEQYAHAAGDAAVATFDLSKNTYDLSGQASSLQEIMSQFGKVSLFETLTDDLDKVKKKLEEVGDATRATFDPKQTAELQVALGKIRQAMVDGIVESSQAGLRSLQSMATDGSKAFKVLQIAIDALTLVQAVSAVLNQGNGDPYSAFARMAAMAAAVAVLVKDFKGFGGVGSSAQTAATQQASQGTGSILGDSTAKSESIEKATKITADATTTLIGINRGMLTALQALQAGLVGASNILAHGAADVAFTGAKDNITNLAGPGSSDPIGGILGGFLFGGQQTVIDKGITIAGGALNDMLNSIVVGAYQTISTDGGLFGSDSISRQTIDISSEFATQFGLVIKSIADTVREGAKALGLLPADVEAAIAAYHVAAIDISLQGLSADDQQKALQAVFSKIFDGLAGAVVPFIGQFQKVGEGLGETLVRVATEVQIVQEARKQLGLTINELDPEKFAQISDSLITAAGGIEAFTSGMSSFVSNFASDSQRFKIDSDALTSAFSQVGLTVPTTRDGMWDLMRSLDATTDAGRQQIATLLRLSDVAGSYYDELEKAGAAQSNYASFIADLGKQGAGISTVSPLTAARLSIEKWEQDSIKQANALAKAAGMQGAAEKDLTLIHEIAAHRIVEAAAAIEAQTADLVDQFYARGKYATESANSATSAIGDFSNAMTSAAQAAQSAAQLLLGELSPLNDQAKLQFALGAYQRGEVNKEDVLGVGRRLYASSQQYTDLFNLLQHMAGGIQNGSDASSASIDTSSAYKHQESADEKQRRLHAEAEQISQNIASLADLRGQSYQQVADVVGANLGDLAKALGLTQDGFTKYLDNLKAQEHAVPDSIDVSADRIVAALYDIAGRAPPQNLAHSTDALPSASESAPQLYAHATRPAPFGADDNGLPVNVTHSAHVPGVNAIPPPASAGAAASDFGSVPNAEVVALLKGLQLRLDAVVQAQKDGTGKIVGAVGENVGATERVGRALTRQEDQAGINVRRNVRAYSP